MSVADVDYEFTQRTASVTTFLLHQIAGGAAWLSLQTALLRGVPGPLILIPVFVFNRGKHRAGKDMEIETESPILDVVQIVTKPVGN